MMWWWMRTAGVCRQALHPSQAQTKRRTDETLPPSMRMRDVVLQNKTLRSVQTPY